MNSVECLYLRRNALLEHYGINYFVIDSNKFNNHFRGIGFYKHGSVLLIIAKMLKPISVKGVFITFSFFLTAQSVNDIYR